MDKLTTERIKYLLKLKEDKELEIKHLQREVDRISIELEEE